MKTTQLCNSTEKRNMRTVGGKDWAATTGCLGKEVKSEPNAQKTETMANFMKRKREQSRTVKHASVL